MRVNSKFTFILGLVIWLGLSGAVLATETDVIKFGLITDTHVCDKPDESPIPTSDPHANYFSGGLAKIAAFTRDVSRRGASFIAHLGDLVDGPAKARELAYEGKRAAALSFVDAAERALAAFEGPRYHVNGNHDNDYLGKDDFRAHVTDTGIAGGASYYSFDRNGIHFIVLDANFTSAGYSYSGVPSAAGFGYAWQDTNVPSEEVAWLRADLASTALPVIVLTHQYLKPPAASDPRFLPQLTVANAAEVRQVLEVNGRVLAVFSGHWHGGGFGQQNGITYVGLRGNVSYGTDVERHNQYATVLVSVDEKKYRVRVTGNGLQESYDFERTLP
jgi:alkaline phosphatase